MNGLYWYKILNKKDGLTKINIKGLENELVEIRRDNKTKIFDTLIFSRDIGETTAESIGLKFLGYENV